MSSVRAEGLSFSYTDAVPVLSGIDVHLPAGFTGIVGENGAGKSTFLRLVAGELEPTGGRVRLEPESALVVHCTQELAEPSRDAAWLATLETPPRGASRPCSA